MGILWDETRVKRLERALSDCQTKVKIDNETTMRAFERLHNRIANLEQKLKVMNPLDYDDVKEQIIDEIVEAIQKR